jgi:hypothetical protein
MEIAQGTRAATLVKRAVSNIGPLVHRDDSRFVSTDTAQIVDQALALESKTRAQSRLGETYAERAGCRHWGCLGSLGNDRGRLGAYWGCGGRSFVTTRGSLGLVAALGFLALVSVLYAS